MSNVPLEDKDLIQKWLLDSAASRNFTNDLTSLSDLKWVGKVVKIVN